MKIMVDGIDGKNNNSSVAIERVSFALLVPTPKLFYGKRYYSSSGV